MQGAWLASWQKTLEFSKITGAFKEVDRGYIELRFRSFLKITGTLFGDPQNKDCIVLWRLDCGLTI